jgi:hypothetical protein
MEIHPSSADDLESLQQLFHQLNPEIAGSSTRRKQSLARPDPTVSPDRYEVAPREVPT